MIPLTCIEGGRISVGEGQALTEGEAKRFLALADRMGRQLKAKVLTRESDALKAEQVVGVLAIPGRTLEILPKVDGGRVRHALLHMIAVAQGMKVADAELAALATQRYDLLELFIQLFVQRLSLAVRRGLPRRYIGHEEDLPVLRGRLNVVRQFTQLAVRPDLLACRYDELSEDTPLNRVLKAAVKRLAGVARTAANTRRLAELAARFEFVGDSAYPLRERVSLDRTSTAFHTLYQMARVFLADESQTTTRGEATGFTLLFEMNVLFEKFIGASLRVLGNRLQRRNRSALMDAEGRELFSLFPDFLIGMPDGRRPIVLDTKWKELKPHDDPHKLGVKESDIYQMLAYVQAYGAERVILLYPWYEALGLDAREIMAKWSAQSGRIGFDIATVDVGNPETVPDALRQIINGLD